VQVKPSRDFGVSSVLGAGSVESLPCQRFKLQELRQFVETHAQSLDAEAGRNPFATAAWLRPYLAHCATASMDYAAVGSDASGWMLLQRAAPGAEWRALNNYYASLYSPWAGAAWPDQAARWRSPGPVLNLMPLAEQQAAQLAQAWRARGWLVRSYDCFANWVLPCAGQRFADFMAQRPSALLNTWKRKRRRFERGDEGARIEIVQDPGRVDAAMDAYEAVYQRSWKQAEPYPGFIRAWARTCAERGWLRLGLAWVGEQAVAAQFWFTVEGRAYIFKLAYDEAFKPWSAGTVLSAALFEQALDQDQVHEVDYLTGDDAYKSHWMNTCQRRVGLVACNPRHPAGLWRGSKEWLGEATQRWRTPEAGVSGA